MPKKSTGLTTTVVIRIDETLMRAMTHVREREGRSLSEQIRIALVEWLRDKKGVLDADVDPLTLTPRRPGRPRSLHRGHVVTYLTDSGMATGLVTDDRDPEQFVIIQLIPPAKEPRVLHRSVIQRRYFKAEQLTSWMMSMPASMVGEEMVEAMRRVRRAHEGSKQELVEKIAGLWFGADWARIDYRPGDRPIYLQDSRGQPGPTPGDAPRERTCHDEP